jgi:hypothetical protein
MENWLIICLVKNEFYTSLFKEQINKHDRFHKKNQSSNPRKKQSEDLD